MIDGEDAEALRLSPADGDQVGGIDVVGGSRIARVAHGILGVKLVLHVPAGHQDSLEWRLWPVQDHATAFRRVLSDGLRFDPRVFFGRENNHRQTRAASDEGRPAPPSEGRPAPPARAGIIETSSPSFRVVPSPSSDSIASLFTYTLT